MSVNLKKSDKGNRTLLPEPEITPSAVGNIKRIANKEICFYYCQIDRENFVYERPVGKGTLDVLSLFVKSAMSDKDRRDGANVLLDLRWANIDVTFRKMFEFAQNLETVGLHLGLKTQSLVLLVNREQSYGKTRMYESIGDKSHQTVYPVRDLESAVALLDVPPELLNAIIEEVDKLEATSG